MRTRPTGPSLVRWISVSRLVSALLFAMIAFQKVPLAVLIVLYGVAICSDLVDGYIARRTRTETYFGKVLDLVSDKSLTIVSLLYAAASGISIFPLALVGTRDVVMMGARLITVKGTPLLPTDRLFGGAMAALLWGNTLLLLIGHKYLFIVTLVRIIYWACALIFMINLAYRAYKSAERISASLRGEE